ncbi:phage tail sheath subtilisin-like domain-containing protein [Candidatus Pacearchaeota archaeon]|jgi:hypothetical protein|nr:phage tail sheath subtilisin-like domain-containing protein [Candidatus Pacearchaeota archaeon]
MTTLYKGVNIIEGQGLSPISGSSQTVTGIMGEFKKGVINKAVVVSNMAEFERVFGDSPLAGITSYYDVEGFFAACGEAPLAIVNIKGSTAAKASLTVVDKAGSPASTLKISAKSQGVWGNGLTVEVLDQNVLVTAPTVTIPVTTAVSATLKSTTGLEKGSFLKFYNGTNTEYKELDSVDHTAGVVHWTGGLTNSYTTANGVISSLEFKIIVYEGSVEVERWEGLSMNDSVTFFCESVIGDNSNYIEVLDLDATGYNAVATNYLTQPAVTSVPVALTTVAGVDGTPTKTEWLGSAAAGTGLYAFAAVPNLFRIACPNPALAVPATDIIEVVQALLSFANSQQDLEVYAEVPYGKTAAEALTFRGNFEGRRLTTIYQWITVTDNGATVWLSNIGPALGAIARKDSNRGIYKSMGNEPLGYGVDIERSLTRTEEETLNEAGINTIIRKNGLRIWGGRTCSASTVWRFVNHSEQFNDLSRTLKSEVGDVTFEPNNAATRAKLVRRVVAYLNEKVTEGGIIAFNVICDATNNPDAQVALGYLNCGIEYQPAGVAEKIVFTVTSSSAGITTTQAA